MSIDGYAYPFAHLAGVDLPGLQTEMITAVTAPHPMTHFKEKGKGPVQIAKELKLDGDFPGCYVLIENEKPFYVGISRAVLNRLCSHAKGESHYTATLAYSIASEAASHDLTRDAAMETKAFQDAFVTAKERIHKASAAFIRIDNPLERYVFEAYCAMYYDTHDWNTFETH